MQTKTFKADTLGDAMEMVRLEFGAEAVIVSTRKDEGGVQVTATLDADEIGDDEDDAQKVPWLRKRHARPDSALDPSDRARQALMYHGVSAPLTSRLVRAVSARYADLDPMGKGQNGNSNEAFRDVIENTFTFRPFNQFSGKPVILVGPAGGGKTVTVAKLAAYHTLNRGRAPGLITADVQRAGGVEQLEGFARILETELNVVASPGGLGDAVTKAWDDNGLFIDTPSTNPFLSSDMNFISDLIEASKAEAILVLPAGGDANEDADIASAFARIGVGNLIITRTDASRRQGVALTAADAGGMVLAGIGISPQISGGLGPLTPRILAGMILPEPEGARKASNHANKNRADLS